MKIDTIAVLRQTPGTALNQLIHLLGYHDAGDGGGGDFYWSPTASENDNNGTIIAVNGANGRWKRIIDGHWNVKWFGAKGNGENDDTNAIQSALNAINDGDTLFFPSTSAFSGKYYLITSGLELNKNTVTLLGDAFSSAYGIQIKATGTSSYAMLTIFGFEAKIISMTFVGNGIVKVLPDGTGEWGADATIDGIMIYGEPGGNGDTNISQCCFSLLKQAIINRARNLLVCDNLISVCQKAILIYNIISGGQNRGFVISRNRFHSIGNNTFAKCIDCADPGVFEVLIMDNYYDGQSNGIFAEIKATSNVFINNNFCTLCRAGFVRLVGTTNGKVNDNYFQGGKIKTADAAIQLINASLICVENNNIDDAAQDGIDLVNSSLNIISSNKLTNWSNPTHAIPGNYDAIKLGTGSIKNEIRNNFMKITSASIAFGGFVNEVTQDSNNITFNITRHFSDVNIYPLTTNAPVHAPAFVIPGVRFWDISQSGSGDLAFNETGIETRFKISSDGNITFKTATLDAVPPTTSLTNTIFVDDSDQKLKFKDQSGVIHNLY